MYPVYGDTVSNDSSLSTRRCFYSQSGQSSNGLIGIQGFRTNRLLHRTLKKHKLLQKLLKTKALYEDLRREVLVNNFSTSSKIDLRVETQSATRQQLEEDDQIIQLVDLHKTVDKMCDHCARLNYNSKLRHKHGLKDCGQKQILTFKSNIILKNKTIEDLHIETNFKNIKSDPGTIKFNKVIDKKSIKTLHTDCPVQANKLIRVTNKKSYYKLGCVEPGLIKEVKPIAELNNSHKIAKTNSDSKASLEDTESDHCLLNMQSVCNQTLQSQTKSENISQASKESKQKLNEKLKEKSYIDKRNINENYDSVEYLKKHKPTNVLKKCSEFLTQIEIKPREGIYNTSISTKSKNVSSKQFEIPKTLRFNQTENYKEYTEEKTVRQSLNSFKLSLPIDLTVNKNKKIQANKIKNKNPKFPITVALINKKSSKSKCKRSLSKKPSSLSRVVESAYFNTKYKDFKLWTVLYPCTTQQQKEQVTKLTSKSFPKLKIRYDAMLLLVRTKSSSHQIHKVIHSIGKESDISKKNIWHTCHKRSKTNCDTSKSKLQIHCFGNCEKNILKIPDTFSEVIVGSRSKKQKQLDIYKDRKLLWYKQVCNNPDKDISINRINRGRQRFDIISNRCLPLLILKSRKSRSTVNILRPFLSDTKKVNSSICIYKSDILTTSKKSKSIEFLYQIKPNYEQKSSSTTQVLFCRTHLNETLQIKSESSIRIITKATQSKDCCVKDNARQEIKRLENNEITLNPSQMVNHDILKKCSIMNTGVTSQREPKNKFKRYECRQNVKIPYQYNRYACRNFTIDRKVRFNSSKSLGISFLKCRGWTSKQNLSITYSKINDLYSKHENSPCIHNVDSRSDKCHPLKRIYYNTYSLRTKDVTPSMKLLILDRSLKAVDAHKTMRNHECIRTPVRKYRLAKIHEVYQTLLCNLNERRHSVSVSDSLNLIGGKRPFYERLAKNKTKPVSPTLSSSVWSVVVQNAQSLLQSSYKDKQTNLSMLYSVHSLLKNMRISLSNLEYRNVRSRSETFTSNKDLKDSNFPQTNVQERFSGAMLFTCFSSRFVSNQNLYHQCYPYCYVMTSYRLKTLVHNLIPHEYRPEDTRSRNHYFTLSTDFNRTRSSSSAEPVKQEQSVTSNGDTENIYRNKFSSQVCSQKKPNVAAIKTLYLNSCFYTVQLQKYEQTRVKRSSKYKEGFTIYSSFDLSKNTDHDKSTINTQTEKKSAPNGRGVPSPRHNRYFCPCSSLDNQPGGPTPVRNRPFCPCASLKNRPACPCASKRNHPGGTAPIQNRPASSYAPELYRPGGYPHIENNPVNPRVLKRNQLAGPAPIHNRSASTYMPEPYRLAGPAPLQNQLASFCAPEPYRSVRPLRMQDKSASTYASESYSPVGLSCLQNKSASPYGPEQYKPAGPTPIQNRSVSSYALESYRPAGPGPLQNQVASFFASKRNKNRPASPRIPERNQPAGPAPILKKPASRRALEENQPAGPPLIQNQSACLGAAKESKAVIPIGMQDRPTSSCAPKQNQLLGPTRIQNRPFRSCAPVRHQPARDSKQNLLVEPSPLKNKPASPCELERNQPAPMQTPPVSPYATKQNHSVGLPPTQNRSFCPCAFIKKKPASPCAHEQNQLVGSAPVQNLPVKNQPGDSSTPGYQPKGPAVIRNQLCPSPAITDQPASTAPIRNQPVSSCAPVRNQPEGPAPTIQNQPVSPCTAVNNKPASPIVLIRTQLGESAALRNRPAGPTPAQNQPWGLKLSTSPCASVKDHLVRHAPVGNQLTDSAPVQIIPACACTSAARCMECNKRIVHFESRIRIDIQVDPTPQVWLDDTDTDNFNRCVNEQNTVRRDTQTISCIKDATKNKNKTSCQKNKTKRTRTKWSLFTLWRRAHSSAHSKNNTVVKNIKACLPLTNSKQKYARRVYRTGTKKQKVPRSNTLRKTVEPPPRHKNVQCECSAPIHSGKDKKLKTKPLYQTVRCECPPLTKSKASQCDCPPPTKPKVKNELNRINHSKAVQFEYPRCTTDTENEDIPKIKIQGSTVGPPRPINLKAQSHSGSKDKKLKQKPRYQKKLCECPPLTDTSEDKKLKEKLRYQMIQRECPLPSDTNKDKELKKKPRYQMIQSESTCTEEDKKLKPKPRFQMIKCKHPPPTDTEEDKKIIQRECPLPTDTNRDKGLKKKPRYQMVQREYRPPTDTAKDKKVKEKARYQNVQCECPPPTDTEEDNKLKEIPRYQMIQRECPLPTDKKVKQKPSYQMIKCESPLSTDTEEDKKLKEIHRYQMIQRECPLPTDTNRYKELKEKAPYQMIQPEYQPPTDTAKGKKVKEKLRYQKIQCECPPPTDTEEEKKLKEKPRYQMIQREYRSPRTEKDKKGKEKPRNQKIQCKCSPPTYTEEDKKLHEKPRYQMMPFECPLPTDKELKEKLRYQMMQRECPLPKNTNKEKKVKQKPREMIECECPLSTETEEDKKLIEKTRYQMIQRECPLSTDKELKEKPRYQMIQSECRPLTDREKDKKLKEKPRHQQIQCECPPPTHTEENKKLKEKPHYQLVQRECPLPKDKELKGKLSYQKIQCECSPQTNAEKVKKLKKKTKTNKAVQYEYPSPTTSEDDFAQLICSTGLRKEKVPKLKRHRITSKNKAVQYEVATESEKIEILRRNLCKPKRLPSTTNKTAQYESSSPTNSENGHSRCKVLYTTVSKTEVPKRNRQQKAIHSPPPILKTINYKYSTPTTSEEDEDEEEDEAEVPISKRFYKAVEPPRPPTPPKSISKTSLSEYGQSLIISKKDKELKRKCKFSLPTDEASRRRRGKALQPERQNKKGSKKDNLKSNKHRETVKSEYSSPSISEKDEPSAIAGHMEASLPERPSLPGSKKDKKTKKIRREAVNSKNSSKSISKKDEQSEIASLSERPLLPGSKKDKSTKSKTVKSENSTPLVSAKNEKSPIVGHIGASLSESQPITGSKKDEERKPRREPATKKVKGSKLTKFREFPKLPSLTDRAKAKNQKQKTSGMPVQSASIIGSLIPEPPSEIKSRIGGWSSCFSFYFHKNHRMMKQAAFNDKKTNKRIQCQSNCHKDKSSQVKHSKILTKAAQTPLKRSCCTWIIQNLEVKTVMNTLRNIPNTEDKTTFTIDEYLPLVSKDNSPGNSKSCVSRTNGSHKLSLHDVSSCEVEI